MPSRFGADAPRPAVSRVVVEDQQVEIRRSTRRTRSVQARRENGVLVVMTPAHLSQAREDELVADMVRRMLTKARSARNDDQLMERARRLSEAFLPGAPMPGSIRWVTTMTTRWASCTPRDASIRLSDKMIGMPGYVIDAVVLHELAHLIESGHGAGFQRLVRANPHHERAEAYLAGAAFGAGMAQPGEASGDQSDGGVLID